MSYDNEQFLGSRRSTDRTEFVRLPLNPADAIESLLVTHSWDYETGECMCGAKGGAKHTAAVIGLWHGQIVGELEDQRDRAEEALALAATAARSYSRFRPGDDS